jgi:aminoglycoside phosphotransferase (APT) family kinase protein
VLADELLGVVRDHLVRPEVEHAEPVTRLGGGFFAENHGFRLAGAPPPWNGPLVVRLFPTSSPPGLARHEATVQTVLAAQGFPAAPVLLFDEHARLSGRQFFVMRRLPGRPVMAGARFGDVSGSSWRLFLRLAAVTAELQAWLHRLDATPLVAELGAAAVGVERVLAIIGSRVAGGAEGLADGLGWLVDHRPARTSRVSICHGDLWGGNILGEGGAVTGVLDWTTATVAEPAFDVGWTAMSLCLAPVAAPRPVQRVAAGLGRSFCRRYVRAYAREIAADLSTQPYYEALRCATELSGVAAYRLAEAKGEPHDVPDFAWGSITDDMVRYFRERTGVTLVLPPVAPP